jgi:hypothetical protein
MDTIVLVVVVVVVALLLLGLALLAGRSRKRKSEHLQERFGPEYERTVEREGGRRAAESELERRELRRRKFQVRALEPETRQRYAATWTAVQTEFVDDPEGALRDADHLVAEVMRDRGYPLDAFERRESHISVDFPEVVEDYRAAHDVSVATEKGESTTEDMRRAMVHYRALFKELLEDDTDEIAERGDGDGGSGGATAAGQRP